MKEDNGMQDVGATAFDYPTEQYPLSKQSIYYGNPHVPKPRNHQAMVTHPGEVMRQVNEAR